MPHNTFNARQWVDDPTSGAVSNWITYYDAQAVDVPLGVDIDTSDENSIQIRVIETALVAGTQMTGYLNFMSGHSLTTYMDTSPIKIHQFTCNDDTTSVISSYNFDLRLEGSTTMRIDLPSLTGGTVTVEYLFGP
jgi:hypothetical protein